MAVAALPPLHRSRFSFSSTVSSNRRELQISVTYFSSSSFSKLLCSSVSWSRTSVLFPDRTRASSEGAPSELVEGPKFVPLNSDDPVYGPPALLLMGFELAETKKIRKFLKEMDGEFLKGFWPFVLQVPRRSSPRVSCHFRRPCVASGKPPRGSELPRGFGKERRIIHCTEDLLTRSIWDAVHTEQPNLKDVKVLKSLPRICFLSGLSGEEMMMFIDAFPEIGLRPAVFAALVPNSADKLLKEVSEEIMADHEMLSAKK